METISIQMPAPDFDFSAMTTIKAKEVCQNNFTGYHLVCFSRPSLDDYKKLKWRLEDVLNDLVDDTQRMLYLSLVLTYLFEQTEALKKTLDEKRMNEHTYTEKLYELNCAKQFFYKQAQGIGYNFDKNAFTSEEVYSIRGTLNDMTNALNELKLGQEVIYNRIDELEEDLTSLGDDFVLGKKKWYQRLKGIVLDYVGEEAAKQVLDALKPFLKDLFQNQLPKLLKD